MQNKSSPEPISGYSTYRVKLYHPNLPWPKCEISRTTVSSLSNTQNRSFTFSNHKVPQFNYAAKHYTRDNNEIGKIKLYIIPHSRNQTLHHRTPFQDPSFPTTEKQIYQFSKLPNSSHSLKFKPPKTALFTKKNNINYRSNPKTQNS